MRRNIHKSFIILSVLTLAFGLLGGCQGQNSSTSKSSDSSVIQIGLQPNEGTADIETFKEELSRLSGLKVNLLISKDYQDLVTKFKEAQVDFAFFSPVNFVTAEKEANAKVLLKKVYGKSEFYFSAIVVMADSNLKTVTDLKSKKVGFVDPKSASGFLYPKSIFSQAGLSDDMYEHSFTGTHENSIQQLADGKFDAVAVWSDTPESNDGAWTDFSKKHVDKKFRVIQYSDPIPNDAFAVRSRFYSEHPEKVFKIMESLISMSDTEAQTLKKVFDTDKMTTATSRHYDGVRKMLKANGQ